MPESYKRLSIINFQKKKRKKKKSKPKSSIILLPSKKQKKRNKNKKTLYKYFYLKNKIEIIRLEDGSSRPGWS